MTWREEAKILYKSLPEGVKPPWQVWGKKLSERYGENVTPDAVRGVCRRLPACEGLSYRQKSLVEPPAKSEGQTAFDADKFLSIVGKNPVSLSELARIFCCSERVVQAHIGDLQENGYILNTDGGQVSLVKNMVVQQEASCEWDGQDIIRFGVVSDTHLCSKYQQITLLNDIYNIFVAEGITKVYHAGDVTEGFKMRPGHEHDIFCHGADSQVDYVVKHYPQRHGITTEFILGNHDYAHVKNGGHDIGIAISNKRPDMKYLGMLNAVIPLTPNCKLELNHPLDGASYATSYSVQKYIDSYHGGEKPNFLINGHHHKALYGLYRNVHYLEAGTFEMQSGWMKGKRIAAHVGGWIVEIRLDADAKISRVKTEWIPYYVFRHNDY
jgi:UDP-2,3-diacylglucosamine pyrophosphatase LpxH/biotin operon repressor